MRRRSSFAKASRREGTDAAGQDGEIATVVEHLRRSASLAMTTRGSIGWRERERDERQWRDPSLRSG